MKAKKLIRSIKAWWSKVGTLNVVLVCVGLFFIWFNYRMLELYKDVGSIPETYACAVIAATIGECGICGWIRTNKDKTQERNWLKEDRKEEMKQKEDETL